jgi:hypothetical protein
MSDDFGTIGVGRSRDVEILRRHREMLSEMAADAPSEELAKEYKRLIANLDTSLRTPTSAGLRPLVTTKLPDTDLVEPRSRLPLIIVAAVLALGLIGALLWYASSDRKRDDGVVVEDATATATTETTETSATETTGTLVPVEGALGISPPAHDYGVIRKGTRATRQYEVVNRSGQPVTISLARSTCRCLYYEYQAVIPPKGRESVTVTIDGAKAKAGEIRETIKVSAKSDPAGGASLDVIATVQ